MTIVKKKQGITNVGENVKKKEPSYTVGETVNWCSHCGKQYANSSKNLELPYDSNIPLLVINQKNIKTLI